MALLSSSIFVVPRHLCGFLIECYGAVFGLAFQRRHLGRGKLPLSQGYFESSELLAAAGKWCKPMVTTSWTAVRDGKSVSRLDPDGFWRLLDAWTG